MAETDLANKLQPRMLAQPVHALGHAEHGADDVVARVAQVPQLVQRLQRGVDLGLPARPDHRLHLDRVRRVHDAEDVVPAHEPEPGPRRLEVVDRLAHVPLGTEDERGDAVLGVLDLLRRADLHEPVDDLGVREAGVPQDGAAGLEGLDDLVGLVAGEGEAGGGRVDFHGAPEGLLCARGHAVGFVEDDEFLAPGGKGYFFLSEGFYAVADDVDSWGRGRLVGEGGEGGEE